MCKNKSFFYSIILTGLIMFFSEPIQAWDDCCEPLDITAEARVAYYHPSSKKVRRIYGDGWADYQLEISKGFKGFGCMGCNGFGDDLEWRIWAGVSGFSRKGESYGYEHHHTRLELIPVNLGLKLFYPIFCNTKIFIGGAGCYSFLRIHDNDHYVHEHVRKESWGGLVQTGLTYNFSCWGVVSIFADYFFQRFHFNHDTHYSSYYSSTYFHDSRYIERHDLNLNGYKIGVGLGVTF